MLEFIKLDVGKSNSSEMSAIGGSWESPILTKLEDNHKDNHENFKGNDPKVMTVKQIANVNEREALRSTNNLLYACSALHYTLNFFITIILGIKSSCEIQLQSDFLDEKSYGDDLYEVFFFLIVNRS
eukprot:scaffold26500_cov93-Skeletonema_dohrnii-CCMP3373.AAC.2